MLFILLWFLFPENEAHIVYGNGQTPFPTEKLLQGSRPGFLGWCWLLRRWSCPQHSAISVFFLPVCVVCEMCASVNTCVQVHTTMCGMMRPEEDTGVLSKTLPYSLGTQPLTEPEARCFWLDWLTSKLPSSSVSVFQLWSYRHAWPPPALGL